MRNLGYQSRSRRTGRIPPPLRPLPACAGKGLAAGIVSVLLLLFCGGASAATEPRMIYTVQAVSSARAEDMIRAARAREVSENDGVRVEKINALYALRIGRYEKRAHALSCLDRIRKVYPGAILRSSYDLPERIVYGGVKAQEESAGKAAPAAAGSGKTGTAQESGAGEQTVPPVGERPPVPAPRGEELVFRGVVSDRKGVPLQDAVVEIIGIPLPAVKTGADGSFAVSGFSAGQVFSLKIAKEGYDTVRTPVIEVPAGIKGQPARYTLSVLAVPAAPATVPDAAPPAPPAAAVLPPPPPPEPEPPAGTAVNIEADSISYDRDDDTYHARGNVVITYSGGVLTARSVVLNRATDDAFADGDVVVKSDQDVLEGQRVVFNLVSKMGVAYQGKMFVAQNHLYLKGQRIEKKGETTYRIYDATATTCDGDSPDWRLTGSMMDVTLEGYGTLRNGRLLAKNVPLFYSPYLIFPAKTARQSGLLYPHVSYSRDINGIDVEVPFYWAISESADATFYQRYMDKRGFKEGVEYRYFLNKDSAGVFYGDYLNDSRQVKETAGVLSRDWQENQKRWSFYLNHETAFSPTSYVRADIMKVSDPWYFRDFNSFNYYLENYSRREQRFRKISFLADEALTAVYSTVRFVKDWPLYNLTGRVEYSDNFNSRTNDDTLQRYPEIILTGIKRPVLGGDYNLDFTGSYDYFYRVEGQKGQMYEIVPALSRPFNLGPYLQGTPELAVRETYWMRDDSDPGGNREGDRPLYRLAMNLNTEVHRIFNIGGQTLDKIRHGIKPELTYTYIPYADQTDMPDYVPGVAEQNTLSYGITNTFLAKLKGKGGAVSYLEFLRLKLSQTYDLKEARRETVDSGPDQRPFSDVDLELDFSPFRYLAFSAQNKFSVNAGQWKQTNYDLVVSDTRGDSATIGYRYTRKGVYTRNFLSTPNFLYTLNVPYAQSDLEETNLSLKAVLTGALDATYVLRRNEFDHITLENTYGLRYRKQCWAVEVAYSERANDTIYTVLISLYGLGQFGQEVWKTTTSPSPQP